MAAPVIYFGDETTLLRGSQHLSSLFITQTTCSVFKYSLHRFLDSLSAVSFNAPCFSFSVSLFFFLKLEFLTFDYPSVAAACFCLFSIEYMAREQNLFELESLYETGRDHLFKQKLSPMSASEVISENESSCFECNICLDSVNNPVVTLCGHLYCWACIYKWLHVQTSSHDANKQQQNCPVCKANISLSKLVPLYGRGTSSSEYQSKKRNLGVDVPHRPPPSMLDTPISISTTSTAHRTPQLHQDLFHRQTQHHSGYAAIATSSLVGMATISFVNPLMGMFGGMVLERIFGSSVTSLFSSYPFSHPLMSSNYRLRRQELEIDKSLNRVSIFLVCCLILCLLLF